jgi:hypothetical protein
MVCKNSALRLLVVALARTMPGVALLVIVAGCSGAGDTSDVPQSVADAWPAKWCQAEPGIMKEQLVAIMGAPTGTSATTMSWSAHQFQFNAFLDPDGTVKQLDTNTYSLSESEKSALQCDNVRTKESVASRAAAEPARNLPSACSLVSAAEMSAILSASVRAEANGESKCIYTPTAEVGPHVEFSVDWGDGEGAMAGIGMATQQEPGLTSPYDGIGDQAVSVGPALMIRTGEDLVTILFSGVEDAPVAARKIFDTAKAKM